MPIARGSCSCKKGSIGHAAQNITGHGRKVSHRSGDVVLVEDELLLQMNHSAA